MAGWVIFQRFRKEPEVSANLLESPKLALVVALYGDGKRSVRTDPPFSGVQRTFAIHRAAMPSSGNRRLQPGARATVRNELVRLAREGRIMGGQRRAASTGRAIAAGCFDYLRPERR
jgi:hypothetical protein